MGKDEKSKKPNRLAKKESTCDPSFRQKPLPKRCVPCPKPSEPPKKEKVCVRNKFPPKPPCKETKPLPVCATKADDKPSKIGALFKKFAGKYKPPTGISGQLSKDKILKLIPKMPKLPPIPKITINKETILSAVNFTKNWIIENCNPKKMAEKSAAGPSRPMKFPYTFSAKFAQFPLKHYFNNQWIWKYYIVSIAVCLPVFYSINKLANSPGNVAKWAEIRRKEAAEHH